MEKVGSSNLKVLLTGTSSGIGRALAHRLNSGGYKVWQVSRKEKSSKDKLYTAIDLTSKNAWKNVSTRLKKKKFIPDIVIFNAAIFENDLLKGPNLKITREVFETNFFSVLGGVAQLMPLLGMGSQLIVISSLSAFKGNGLEGIGYAASKSAISIAFESLHQKYKKSGIEFKIIFFGPVKTGMNPFTNHSAFSLSEKQAVDAIIRSMKSVGVFYYYPRYLFIIIKIAKLLSQRLYFSLLDFIETAYKRKIK